MNLSSRNKALQGQTRVLQRRMNTFARVIRFTLMVVGIGAIISQLAQISPFLESYPGWTLSYSNMKTLILGIIFFFLGKSRAVENLVYFSLFSGREKMKRFLFILPFFATIILIIAKIRLGDSRSYRMILDEGGFIEYGTVIAYYLATGFSIPIGRLFFQLHQKVLGLGYYLYGAFFLFVALEEVSWGQRLFGWEVPRFFKVYNSQEELTIHNLVWFRSHIGEVIIIISSICLLGGIFWFRSYYRKRTTHHYITYLFPGWFLGSFFVLPLIIYAILEYTDKFGFFISGDEEFAELLLSLGFLFFVITSYFRQALEVESYGQEHRATHYFSGENVRSQKNR